MWPGPPVVATPADLQSSGAQPNLSVAVLFVLMVFSLCTSCDQSSTNDQKGVKPAFYRYHACLGRKVSKAVGRPPIPLLQRCLDMLVGSIFGKIFPVSKAFSQNEKESNAIE